MNGEEQRPLDGETTVQRHFLAAHAGQFVDWLLGGVKEALGPSLPPGRSSEHTVPLEGAAASEGVKQEGEL